MRDRRTTIIYLVLISIFLISMMALMISAQQTDTKIGAKAFALYNPNTNTFVWGKNTELKLPMASTTKILTALIALETLDLDETITVPKEAAGIEGSSVYLAEGDQISARDLIYSVLLQSANDAAATLALRIGGTIQGFSELMNARARSIGADDSNFENPHGLDSENHYTTAKDLALISAEALKNDTFKKITSTYKYSFMIGDKTRTLINHNKLLKQYKGCIGVKTGYTKRCGRCLVSAAEKNGITLIAVTLSAPNDWRDHTQLLDRGFDLLESVDLLSKISIPETIPVISGNKDIIKIGIRPEDRYLVKYKDASDFIADVQLHPYIANSLNAGEKVGKITIKTENTTKEIDIIALEEVKVKSKKLPFFS